MASLIREVGARHQRFKTVSVRGFTAAEVLIEVEAVPDVTLRGSVDAVFADDAGEVRLIDWKAGGLYEVEQRLAFYALLWALDCGRLLDLLEALSVQSGERAVQVPTATDVTATARSVAAMVVVLREALADGREELDRSPVLGADTARCSRVAGRGGRPYWSPATSRRSGSGDVPRLAGLGRMQHTCDVVDAIEQLAA